MAGKKKGREGVESGAGDGMPILQGTLDVLILTMLAEEPDHGYGVTRRIRDRTEGELSLDDGALYQSLHRMRARGLIRGEWGVSDRGRRARFYHVTADGHGHLEKGRASWSRYADAVAKVLGTT